MAVNKFVLDRFIELLRRDYGFKPETITSADGNSVDIIVTVPDRELRKHMRNMTIERVVGFKDVLKNGEKVTIGIVKKFPFIHYEDSFAKDFDRLIISLDINSDAAAKINTIEHGLREYRASRRIDTITV